MVKPRTRSEAKILDMRTHIQKSTNSKTGFWYITLPTTVVAATLLISTSSTGAVDIQSINLGTLTDGSDTTKNNVTYQNKSQSITSFTTLENNINTTWDVGSGLTPTFILRRNGTGGGGRQVVWGRRQGGGTSPYVILPPQPTTTQAALEQNNIYSGADNLFTNISNPDTNHSNVQRADIIFGSGLTTASNLGISVFERGLPKKHDGFKIAAITGLSGTTPTQYGTTILSYTRSNNWGRTDLTGDNQPYVVLNDSAANSNTDTGVSTGTFRPTHNVSQQVSQQIGGVLIRLTELAPQGTTIFGYSLFAADLPNNATNANLINTADTTYFPTNTTDLRGGLDLVAADLGVSRARAVPFGFSPSLGLLILGAIWGVPSLWQRYRIKSVKYPCNLPLA